MRKKRMKHYMVRYIKSRRRKGKSFVKIFHSLLDIVFSSISEVNSEEKLHDVDERSLDLEELDDYWG